MAESQRKRRMLIAFRVAAICAIAGALWILFSDRILLQKIDGDVAELGRLQTYKGCFFIAVTASLLKGLAIQKDERDMLSDRVRMNQA